MNEQEDDKDWSGSDRRVHPRVEFDLAGHVLTGEPESLVVRARNISCSGVYCHINRYIPPYQKLHLAMIIPLEDGDKIHSEIVKLDGVIVRVEPEEPNKDVLDYHIAIFFESISDRDREIIEKFVEQRQARQGN